MGKDWDSDKGGGKEWTNWLSQVMRECYRVMKPGAHGLVWALPRISHRTAMAIEWSGLEVRDVVTHLFGSGFPKSLDISKAIDKKAGATREILGKGKAGKSSIGQETRVVQGARPTIRDGSDFNITAPRTDDAKRWDGWGTALKPAAEFWFLVRKPLEGSVSQNVLKWGTGGINIDASRVGNTGGPSSVGEPNFKNQVYGNGMGGLPSVNGNKGRFPANLVLDETAAQMLDEQSGISAPQKTRVGKPGGSNAGHMSRARGDNKFNQEGLGVWPGGDGGGASRFFYVAKPSKHERNFGVEGVAGVGALRDVGGESQPRANFHPTVKPYKLMRYFVGMITPPGGTVLDCFMGSGTTGTVAVACGFRFVGIEQDAKFLEIARSRISSVKLSRDVVDKKIE